MWEISWVDGLALAYQEGFRSIQPTEKKFEFLEIVFLNKREWNIELRGMLGIGFRAWTTISFSRRTQPHEKGEVE
jgi:hypothetical protein